MTRLSLVREFWDETPCDGQTSYAFRARLRYGKEPWLQPTLVRIATTYHNILEVGCGQGTDGVTLCQLMAAGGTYTGVDMSAVSLHSARAAAEEMAGLLHVKPVFVLDNAEQLSFADNTFDCVVSVGALHHSESTERAVAEVRRVLAPGGATFVCLYRTLSPKVLAAHALRALQRCIDGALRQERSLYKITRSLRAGHNWGTALDECFGVPILRSYTRREMRMLFRNFASLSLSSHGVGLPPLGINRWIEGSGSNALGYLWLAEAMK